MFMLTEEKKTKLSVQYLLARAVISSGISPDYLTNVNILANAYCILMEKGPGNELMTEALKIVQLWQHGLPIS